MKARTPLHIFYCYAREDKPFRDALDRHLSGLKRQKLLITWSDQEIRPGEEWKTAIDTSLQKAHIILCLVSSDFLASDYCYEQEMQQSLERHKEGTARVIPILVRPTYWENTPLHELQMLPSNASAVTLWHDPDAAWLNIVTSILPIIQELSLTLEGKEAWLEGALTADEQVIRFNSNNNTTLERNGSTLSDLGRYQEALEAAERAIQLNPDDNAAFLLKSYFLNDLGRYQEALEAAERAIQLNPANNAAFLLKSSALNDLGRYQEALEAAERAIQLNPADKAAFLLKSSSLGNLIRLRGN